MKIFFDTNVVMDFLLEREGAVLVNDILDSVAENEWDCCISSGSLYTMAYTIDKYLRQRDKFSPTPTGKTARLAELRNTLLAVTDFFEIVGMTSASATKAINNLEFDDIEDSFQHISSIAAGCDILLTFNIGDFENVTGTDIDILTPAMFKQKYM